MKKKMIYVFITTLLIVAIVIPVSGSINNNKISSNVSVLHDYSTKQTIDEEWSEMAKLTASDATYDDVFGCWVSIDGDYAIVGAYRDDDNGDGSGSAYIFKRSGTTWIQEDKLTASDASPGDIFGVSVSIDGDYALVGAPGDNFLTGSAYIFKRSGTTWNQEDKLTASDGGYEDHFGCSVSIDSDYALVGAMSHYGGTGSAYIFKRSGTTWNQEDKLTASDADFDEFFGVSVSIDGDYALVGAIGDDGFTGSAYIFKRSGTTWNQEDKLTAVDGTAEDWFGSVSIDGDYALIGAPGDDGDTGSAYIFKRSGTTWIQEDKLTASDGGYEDHFGSSVSIDGDYALIGAIGDDSDTGSAYIFKRSGTTWIQEDKLTASDGTAEDGFGCYVSIDGNFTIIGAAGDHFNTGSAYIFVKNKPPNPPTIDGPTSGKPGEELCWTFSSVDPDGDDIMYIIDWDDGETTETECYPSGLEVEECHTYAEPGTYIIRVKAKDCLYGLESDWAELTVTMPRNRATYNSLFLRFLEQFPILQKILLCLIK